MRVEFGCPQCGRAVEAGPGEQVACRRCGAEVSLPAAPEALEHCLVCECPELYRHRDFNARLGLLIVVVGVILWFVLGSFWPMVIAAALDLVLYFVLPDVAICYRCKAHHRDASNVKALATFSLERYEHFRFEQARRERSGE